MKEGWIDDTEIYLGKNPNLLQRTMFKVRATISDPVIPYEFNQDAIDTFRAELSSLPPAEHERIRESIRLINQDFLSTYG